MRDAELQVWLDRCQDYVDGALSKKHALQFYLLTRREPRLKAELDAYRAMTAALDEAPLAQPSESFDAKILASVPLDRYQNAPQAPERTLVLGDDRESVLERMRRPIGRGMAATAVAYVLFLAVSHSFLSQGAIRVAESIRAGLDSLSTRVDSVPVLSSVVDLVARTYDLGTDAVAALSTVVGTGVVTVLVGLLTGLVAIAIVSGRRRRPIDG